MFLSLCLCGSVYVSLREKYYSTVRMYTHAFTQTYTCTLYTTGTLHACLYACEYMCTHITQRVPPEHCPDSWGRREEWLANIRRVRTRTGDMRPTRPEGDAAGGAGGAAAEQGGGGDDTADHEGSRCAVS